LFEQWLQGVRVADKLQSPLVGRSRFLRRGELLGLQWGDIDLDAVPPTLRVERSVEETKAGGLRLKPPKTKRGRRSISLPPETVVMLRELKVEQMQIRLAIGMASSKAQLSSLATWRAGLCAPAT
jgi:hypothetical protein